MTEFVYAHPGAEGSIFITWDRAGRFHILTTQSRPEEISANDGWEERRFKVSYEMMERIRHV